MRTTKKQVNAVFERFIKAIGGRVASNYNDVGGYILDHNATYGGYIIELVISNTGGVTNPCGNKRYTASEFVDRLFFAIEAIDISKGK